MRLVDLMEQLDELAWDEQLDFEMRERSTNAGAPEGDPTERALAKLGHDVDPSTLSRLEATVGYEVWAARLSPHVAQDDTAARLRRLAKHPDPAVRGWAAMLAAGDSNPLM